jgi:hypothetical protein
MANRSQRRTVEPSATFKSRFVTNGQLDEFEKRLASVVSAFGARLSITEFAVKQIIDDVYYSEQPGEVDPELTEDGLTDEEFEALADQAEADDIERGEPHEDDRQFVDDDEAARLLALQLQAEADWEGEGGR